MTQAQRQKLAEKISGEAIQQSLALQAINKVDLEARVETRNWALTFLKDSLETIAPKSQAKGTLAKVLEAMQNDGAWAGKQI